MSEVERHTTAERAVLVEETGSGYLIVGDDDAVAEFVARWSAEAGIEPRRTELTGRDLRSAVSIAADVAAVRATAAQFVWAKRSAARGDTVVLREWVTRKGKIVSNRAVSPAAAAVVSPQALAILALRVAVEESTERIVAAVERVEGKTDELLRLAGAERAGDVVGHHRLLRRRVDRIDEGTMLGETDWSTVASLGPELEVGVARLRDYAERLAADLPPGLGASERVRRLERVVDDGRLGEVLRLLVVAQQSLYLWQRLRISRIEQIEPAALDGAVADAHAVLAENLEADAALVDQLRGALDAYGVLAPFEFHRAFSGRKLRSSVELLRRDLDYFVDARGMQVEGWTQLVAPTPWDALRHARTRAVDTGRQVRAVGSSVLDGGLAGVSRAGGAIQSTAERLRDKSSDREPPPVE